MYNNGVGLHGPLKGPVAPRRTSTARGVACQTASQKVSRCKGVQQLHLRVSRYTVQLWSHGLTFKVLSMAETSNRLLETNAK